MIAASWRAPWVEMYMKVNYEGTLNVINACKSLGIKKIVMSSSPSTRFDGKDINGKRESELVIPETFLQEYAESKARGEEACMAACDGKDPLTAGSGSVSHTFQQGSSPFKPNTQAQAAFTLFFSFSKSLVTHHSL